MKLTRIVAPALVVAAIVVGQTCRGEGEKKAHADLIDSKNKPIGTAHLHDTGKGVKIEADLSGLPPGVHAFHIHAAAKCDCPDFKSSGGHFNPFGKKHGVKNKEGPHAGDLPNITVDKEGKCHVDVTAELVTLEKGKKNSLLDGEGTSIMIHEKPDDDMTDPAGNAGNRIACGVVKGD
jgi:Cu-Zn family superoxide dismutase